MVLRGGLQDGWVFRRLGRLTRPGERPRERPFLDPPDREDQKERRAPGKVLEEIAAARLEQEIQPVDRNCKNECGENDADNTGRLTPDGAIPPRTARRIASST